MAVKDFEELFLLAQDGCVKVAPEHPLALE